MFSQFSADLEGFGFIRPGTDRTRNGGRHLASEGGAKSRPQMRSVFRSGIALVRLAVSNHGGGFMNVGHGFGMKKPMISQQHRCGHDEADDHNLHHIHHRSIFHAHTYVGAIAVDRASGPVAYHLPPDPARGAHRRPHCRNRRVRPFRF